MTPSTELVVVAAPTASKERAVVTKGVEFGAMDRLDLANPKANVRKHGFTPEERAGFDAFVRAGLPESRWPMLLHFGLSIGGYFGL